MQFTLAPQELSCAFLHPLPDSRHVTQEDVARIAKVNRATVSLAIHDHPSISAKTRERIKRIAADLGYRLDPMLSALASYRNHQRPSQLRGTLGWLARTTPDFNWRRIEHFATYLDGARRRAEHLGYRLDIVDLGETGMSWSRAAEVIHARGIAGVIFCPQPNPDTSVSTFPWEELAGVTFGYSITQPALNSVAPAQFRAAFTTYREVQRRGYRRIGFAMNRNHDERIDHNYLGGYLAARELDPLATPVRPFLVDSTNEAAFPAWLEQNEPDALIAPEIMLERLHALGYEPPKKIGFACPFLGSRKSETSGVWESSDNIAAAAVDTLVSMLYSGQRGIPERPQRILIEGTWSEGRTLRPAST